MNSELVESYRFCDELSRREAKNFYYSFRLLPKDRRASMSALYAFLRRTDDLADETDSVDNKKRALDHWRQDLDDAVEGRRFGWPGLQALGDMVARHGLPTRYLIDVIDGVEMDLSQTTYETFADLHRYCYRVASAVGISCLYVWGFRSENGVAEDLAEATGVALQLTNILRDVREDAVQGRVYIPSEDLDRFGVTRESILTGKMTPSLHSLFAFQAERARAFYAQGASLARLVDPVGRPVLATITGIYRALLDEITASDYDVLAQRRRVPTWKKFTITAHAWLYRHKAVQEVANAARETEPSR